MARYRRASALRRRRRGPGADGEWITRGAGERVSAWLITGPLGHFYSALADLAAVVVRGALSRARQR